MLIPVPNCPWIHDSQGITQSLLNSCRSFILDVPQRAAGVEHVLVIISDTKGKTADEIESFYRLVGIPDKRFGALSPNFTCPCPLRLVKQATDRRISVVFPFWADYSSWDKDALLKISPQAFASHMGLAVESILRSCVRCSTKVSIVSVEKPAIEADIPAKTTSDLPQPSTVSPSATTPGFVYRR